MDNTEKTNIKSSSSENSEKLNENFRVRLTAVALYMLGDSASIPPGPETNWTFRQNNLDKIKIGTLQHGSAGLIHALVNENRIILLPKITRSDQCHDIYADLLKFFNHDLDYIKWIIDCSSLNELPLLLLSNLIAYTHKLRSRGSNLHLCWFKPEFIPEPQRGKLCDFFHLELIGGYLFSKSQ